MKFNSLLSRMHGNLSSRLNSKSKDQKGFTLIELLIVVAVISVLALGANAGLNLRNDQVGSNEGKVINYAMACIQSKTSQPTYISATMATMTNLGCFQDELVTGKGTAAAAATSNLVGTAYTIAPVTLNSANDGVGITVAAVPSKNCPGVVKAVSQSATRVSVTPTGGTLVVVKPIGGVLDDSALGLACASSASNSAAVLSVIGKS